MVESGYLYLNTKCYDEIIIPNVFESKFEINNSTLSFYIDYSEFRFASTELLQKKTVDLIDCLSSPYLAKRTTSRAIITSSFVGIIKTFTGECG
jgi:hypothetical protein